MPFIAMGSICCIVIASFLGLCVGQVRQDVPLDQQLFFSTVRIHSSNESSSTSGSGFIFQHNSNNYIVTCRHVLSSATISTFFFTESINDAPRLFSGDKERRECSAVLSNLQSVVLYHPDSLVDVAIISLKYVLQSHLVRCSNKGGKPYFIPIPDSLIPTENEAKLLNFIQPILFIGYPTGLFDVRTNLPLARHGFTASPYILDWHDKSQFIIDASVFPGSSGSPVFVLEQGSYYAGNTMTVGKTRILFLGMLSAAYIPPIVVNQTTFINLGIAAKPKLILETLSFRNGNKKDEL